MMLFLQGFDSEKNIYMNDYSFSGQSVSGKDSARFFADRFKELTSGPSQCSALTIDVRKMWLCVCACVSVCVSVCLLRTCFLFFSFLFSFLFSFFFPPFPFTVACFAFTIARYPLLEGPCGGVLLFGRSVRHRRSAGNVRQRSLRRCPCTQASYQG